MLSKDAAIKQLLEFYGIPPQHNSDRRGDFDLVKNIEACFSKPLVEVEKDLGFDRIKSFYDGQARRVGKEVSALAKQLSR